MSRLANLFKKKEVTMTAQESLQKLRETEDMLLKKQTFVEQKMAQEQENAKKYGMKNKRLALQALRRKKNLEKQLQHIDGVLGTIQHQRDSLENTSVNTEVLQVLMEANKTMKQANQNLDVDKVHDIMEDIAEQKEVADEIANAISSPIGMEEDDSDLLAELQKLEEETLDSQLLNVGPSADLGPLPDAPTEDLPQRNKKGAKEEDEMAELKAWAEA